MSGDSYQGQAQSGGRIPLLDRAAREPLGVDISDFSDEYCAGFLAGQVNALEEGEFEWERECAAAETRVAELLREREETAAHIHSLEARLDQREKQRGTSEQGLTEAEVGKVADWLFGAEE